MRFVKKVEEVEAELIDEGRVDAWGYQSARGPQLVVNKEGRTLDCREHPEWSRFGLVPFVKLANGQLTHCAIGDYRVTYPGGIQMIVSAMQFESGFEPELPPFVEMVDATAVDAVARVAHEVNRAYCAAIGDATQLPWELAPEWQRDSAISGVQQIRAGLITTPGDSHRSWLTQKVNDGWQYGEVKSAADKTHPCLVPFDALPVEQQIKDHLFLAVCRALLGEPSEVPVAAPAS